MTRSEASRGVWLASMLGLPAVNAALLYIFGVSAPLLGGALLVELAVVSTRLRPRSRREAAGLLILVALAIAAGTTILLMLTPVLYVIAVCGFAGEPCFS